MERKDYLETAVVMTLSVGQEEGREREREEGEREITMEGRSEGSRGD